MSGSRRRLLASFVRSCCLLSFLRTDGVPVAANQESTASTWYRQVCVTDGRLYEGRRDGESVVPLEPNGDRHRRKRRLGASFSSASTSAAHPASTTGSFTLSERSGFSFLQRALSSDELNSNGTVLDPESDPNILYFRRCDCFDDSRTSPQPPDLFCPDSAYGESEVLCGIPADWTQPIDCYDYSIKRVVVRNAWPLVVLWFTGLFLVCLCTVHGRSSLGYLHAIHPWLCCHSRERQHELLELSLDRIQDLANHNGETFTSPPRYRLLLWQRAQLDRLVVAFARHAPILPLVVSEQNHAPNSRNSIRSILLGTQDRSVNDACPVQPQLLLRTKIYRSKLEEADDSNTVALSTSAKAIKNMTTAQGTSSPTLESDRAGKSQQIGSCRGEVHANKGCRDHCINAKLDVSDIRVGPATEVRVDDDNDDQNVSSTPTTAIATAAVGAVTKRAEASAGVVSESTTVEAHQRTISASSSIHGANNIGSLEIDGCSSFGDDDDDDGDDNNTTACAICFVPLRDGDRLGDLVCKHNFHVECLKTWLPHRNTCPLCQAPYVARYRLASATHDQSASNRLTPFEGRASNDGIPMGAVSPWTYISPVMLYHQIRTNGLWQRTGHSLRQHR